MTLGEKIYKLRTKRSMTQEQLADPNGKQTVPFRI